MALTRTVMRNEEVLVGLPKPETFERLVRALKEVGRVQSTEPGPCHMTGSIRSGHLGMNKATISVSVEQVDAKSSRARFSMSAQEGLIDQNTSGRALSRLLEVAQLPGQIDDTAVCPWCAETIKAEARVCRFCGRDVAAS